jgi:hypothetical protein
LPWLQLWWGLPMLQFLCIANFVKLLVMEALFRDVRLPHADGGGENCSPQG